MMHIFIFNNASRAANYGIGTYVRLLADGLFGHSGVKVSFVDMFSDVKEYSIAEDERGCVITRFRLCFRAWRMSLNCPQLCFIF